MKVDGVPYRSIWLNDDSWSVDIIDQTRLPHEFVVKTLQSVVDAIVVEGDSVKVETIIPANPNDTLRNVRGEPMEPPDGFDLADQRNHFTHGLDGFFYVFVCVDG